MSLPKYVTVSQSTANADGGFVDLTADQSSEIVDASGTNQIALSLGGGNDTIAAGDGDWVYMGSGNDTFFGARDSVVSAGSGHDTFVYGVSAKGQSPGMLGTETLFGYNTSADSIQISHSILSAAALAQIIAHPDQHGVTNNGVFQGVGAEWYIPLNHSGDGLDIVSSSTTTSFSDIAKTIKIV